MAEALRGKFITSADGKKFLPLDQLKAIVTETAVQSLLDKIFTTQSLSAHDICPRQESQDRNNRTPPSSRQKIFATLALISKVRLIRDFITENITDSDLPLEQRTTTAGSFLVKRSVNSDPDPNYTFPPKSGGWAYNDIPLFCDNQWTVLAPYFAGAEDHDEKAHFYSFTPDTVLPFVKPGTDDQGNPAFLNQGFFSTVRRVKIHKAHHNFPVPNKHDEADFAVKKITRVHDILPDNYKKCCDIEVEALKKFCRRNERYIIKLLATYEIGGVYHLLFPVANGNLMDLWKDSLPDGRLPAQIPRATLWLAQECLGIAQALGKIHLLTSSSLQDESSQRPERRIHGIHGDIKPQNVLWFKELPVHLQGSSDTPDFASSSDIPKLGYLQLSDFGTVYFHREMSMNYNEILVKNNTYRAPESDRDVPQGSPALDIWAFGCLYLDLITWFLCGHSAVDEEFPSARTQDEPEPSEEGRPKQDTFFISSRGWLKRNKTHIVKPSVTEWIAYLHKQPQCSQFLHEFLDFIEAHMLVVSLKDRVQCTGVVQELQRLKRKCDETRKYHEDGKPLVWTSFTFNYLLMNRTIKKLGRTMRSHGQTVFGLVLVVYFLIWMFQAQFLDSDSPL
ncbi:kinase-like domain-containing protein [Xylaria flabelliformis]|nr:kinase-like domain-containing protein [Xylaria flabelliformis]